MEGIVEVVSDVNQTPVELNHASGNSIVDTSCSSSSNNENKNINAPSTPSNGETTKMSLRMEIMMRKEQKKLEEEAQYTYKPKLYPASAEKKNEKIIYEDEGGRFSRLYKDAQNRNISQQLREEAGALDKECTFSPKLPASPVPRIKTADLMTMKTHTPNGKEYHDPQLTFKPNLFTKKTSPNSKGLSKSASKVSLASSQPHDLNQSTTSEVGEGVDLITRLFEYEKKHQEKLMQQRQAFEQAELAECTFSPNTNKHHHIVNGNGNDMNGNRRHSLPSTTFTTSNTTNTILKVEDRLTNYEALRKAHLTQRRAELEAKERVGLTFKPVMVTSTRGVGHHCDLDHHNDSITGSNGSGPQPVYERLSRPTSKTPSPAVKEHLANYTYKPIIYTALSPNNHHKSSSPTLTHSGSASNVSHSHSLSPYKSPLERLYYNGITQKQQQQVEYEARKVAIETAELTLKPTISSYKLTPSDNHNGNDSVFDRLATTPTTAQPVTANRQVVQVLQTTQSFRTVKSSGTMSSHKSNKSTNGVKDVVQEPVKEKERVEHDEDHHHDEANEEEEEEEEEEEVVVVEGELNDLDLSMDMNSLNVSMDNGNTPMKPTVSEEVVAEAEEVVIQAAPVEVAVEVAVAVEAPVVVVAKEEETTTVVIETETQIETIQVEEVKVEEQVQEQQEVEEVETLPQQTQETN